MHILPAPGLWDDADDRGNVKPVSTVQVSLSQAERTVFASTNRGVEGENCMFNKAAASAVKKITTTPMLLFFIYGDCYLSFEGGDTFYLTVADIWWSAELWKSTQVHVLLTVLLFGRTGPSLSHSPKQVMDLDPNECLTMRGSALPRLSTKWFMLLMRLSGRRQ